MNLRVVNNKMGKGKKTKPNRAQKKRVPAREGAEENLKISEVTEEVLKEELGVEERPCTTPPSLVPSLSSARLGLSACTRISELSSMPSVSMLLVSAFP